MIDIFIKVSIQNIDGEIDYDINENIDKFLTIISKSDFKMLNSINKPLIEYNKIDNAISLIDLGDSDYAQVINLDELTDIASETPIEADSEPIIENKQDDEPITIKDKDLSWNEIEKWCKDNLKQDQTDKLKKIFYAPGLTKSQIQTRCSVGYPKALGIYNLIKDIENGEYEEVEKEPEVVNDDNPW